MKIGSPEHRDLFCRTFIESHRPYEPAALPWPRLEPIYLERLRQIPFWGIAFGMEHKAGIMVRGFADTIEDPIIRQAVAVQGFEEDRHARLMEHIIERYDLPATPADMPQPAPVRDDFVLFGYEECVDAFMGYGLFGVAAEIEYFPRDFSAVFEEVLFEETRHVTFFVNWYRYEEARAGRDKFGARHLLAVRNYVRALQRVIGAFAGEATTGFAAKGAGAMIEGVTPEKFLRAAIAENDRQMSRLDSRLIKPSLLPWAARIALAAIRALPPLEAHPQTEHPKLRAVV